MQCRQKQTKKGAAHSNLSILYCSSFSISISHQKVRSLHRSKVNGVAHHISRYTASVSGQQTHSHSCCDRTVITALRQRQMFCKSVRNVDALLQCHDPHHLILSHRPFLQHFAIFHQKYVLEIHVKFTISNLFTPCLRLKTSQKTPAFSTKLKHNTALPNHDKWLYVAHREYFAV